jgi:hypothetical protein
MLLYCNILVDLLYYFSVYSTEMYGNGHFELCTILKYFNYIYGRKVKKDKMVGACSTNGEEEECI